MTPAQMPTLPPVAPRPAWPSKRPVVPILDEEEGPLDLYEIAHLPGFDGTAEDRQ